MKKRNLFIVLALCVCLVAVVFTGCSNKNGRDYDNAAGPSSRRKKSV